LFQPGAPISKDFYQELPINIKVIGRYEELALFVSGLAALPRIVTVHDVKITPGTEGVSKDNLEGTMVMEAVVKTYNEQQSGNTANAPSVRTVR
jgi:type IV pilus assembly protein PilO